MQKKHIITLVVVSVIALIVGIVVWQLDRIVTNIARQQLDEYIEDHNIPLAYKDVRVEVLSGNLTLYDPTLCLQEKDNNTNDSIYTRLSLEKIMVKHLHWLQLLRKRIVHIDALQVDNGQLSFHHTTNKECVEIERFTATMYDIAYSIPNDTLTYSDNRYHISLEGLEYTTSDGLMRLVCRSLSTRNAGAIEITDLKGGHTIEKTQLARAKGKIPTTWTQFDFASVTTSPVNLFTIFQSYCVDIDNMDIVSRSVHIYRDNQYAPKHPYPMPQEAIMGFALPLHIEQITLGLDSMLVELTMTGKTVGQLRLGATQGTIGHLTNTSKQVTTAHIHTTIEQTAQADLTLTLTNDKSCHFTMEGHIHDAQGQQFNAFLTPLFGVHLDADIHQVDVQHSGDRNQTNGTFCMLYDDLKVDIIKDATPLDKLSKHAGIINAFAPAIVINRNPRNKNNEPQQYAVQWTRDPMKNTPVYLLGPMIDGIIQTVLPPNIANMIKKKMATPKR